MNAKSKILTVALLALITLTEVGAAAPPEPLIASGSVQAREMRIASEHGGRVLEILARAGDTVSAGDTLVTLDATPWLLQLSLAEAAVATAAAELAVVQAGPRPAEIAAAQAALSMAQAQREAAQTAWGNALEAIGNPLALDAEIASARTQLDLARQGVELARAELAKQQLLRDQRQGFERNMADLQVRAAEQALAGAQADERTATTLLNWLWVIREEPLGLIAAAHFAEGEYQLAEAAVVVAQAELHDLLAGPAAAEVAVARAALAHMEAEAEVLRVQVAQLPLTSFLNGVIVEQVLWPGEIAAPGATILTVADLSQVTLSVFVPENRVGEVQLGQAVTVTVDSLPGRVFEGQVIRIGDQPEYTPRNVVTAEQRLNTFFRIEIRLPNPDRALKPGMPADAVFRDSGP